MSYDLWFWNQDESCTLGPVTIESRLCEGGELPGLQTLDFDAIKARISAELPEFNGQLFQVDGHYFTFDAYPPAGFQIVTDPPDSDLIRDNLNTLIDIACGFGCRLYDPQVGTRYD